MTEPARYDVDAVRAEFRAQPKADADLLRAVHLYNIAMLLITGRGPAAPNTRRLSAAMAAAIDIYQDLLRASDDVLEDEIKIWYGLGALAVERVFEQEHGRYRRRKRRQRTRGPLHMRLDNPHYLAAWFVEQHRRYWCDQNNERYCPEEVLGQIRQAVIEHTRTAFGLPLSDLQLGRRLREVKQRRLTQIFYRD